MEMADRKGRTKGRGKAGWDIEAGEGICMFIVISEASEASTWLSGKAPHCIYVPAPTLFRQSYHIKHHKAYALLEVITSP